MIHVRVDNHHSNTVDIYVNISPKNMIRSSSSSSSSSSSIPTSDYHSNEHIYDHLFDAQNSVLRQSKIVKNHKDYTHSMKRKNYTLKQILDNVETIQQQYEQFVDHRRISTSSSAPSSTCFLTFKQIARVLKNIRTIKTKTNDETMKSNYLENRSPFIFGGETLQWIALPQDDDHIYENDFIQ